MAILYSLFSTPHTSMFASGRSLPGTCLVYAATVLIPSKVYLNHAFLRHVFLPKPDIVVDRLGNVCLLTSYLDSILKSTLGPRNIVLVLCVRILDRTLA